MSIFIFIIGCCNISYLIIIAIKLCLTIQNITVLESIFSAWLKAYIFHNALTYTKVMHTQKRVKRISCYFTKHCDNVHNIIWHCHWIIVSKAILSWPSVLNWRAKLGIGFLNIDMLYNLRGQNLWDYGFVYMAGIVCFF